MELFVHTDRGSSEEIEDVIAHALWEKGYRGNVYSPSTGNSTEIRDLRGVSSAVGGNRATVLSIDKEFLDDNGYDGQWVLDHDMLQECANKYWEGISSGLAMYDPFDEMMELLNIPHLEDKDDDDLMGGEERHLDDQSGPDEDSPDMLVDETPLGIALDDNPI